MWLDSVFSKFGQPDLLGVSFAVASFQSVHRCKSTRRAIGKACGMLWWLEMRWEESGLWEGAYLLWWDILMSFGPWRLKPTSVTALPLVKRTRAQETTHLSYMTRLGMGGTHHRKNRGSHVFIPGMGERQISKMDSGRTEMGALRGPKYSWHALESGCNSFPHFSEAVSQRNVSFYIL